MKIKQILSALLAVLTLLPLAACSDTPDADEETSAALPSDSESTVAEAESASSKYSDNLPELDFKGADFVIMCREEQEYETFAEEMNGAAINDAVYLRNTAIGERFNVKIKDYAIPGYWTYREDFMNALKNSVMAGAKAFDLVVGYSHYLIGSVTQDLFYNINDLKYTDTTAPYYFADANKELSFAGNRYFMVSDFCKTVWEYLYVMFFNKSLAEANSLPDLYQMVRDGTWTLPAVMKMSKDIYVDVNGDGKKDAGDSFGYLGEYDNVADAFAASVNTPITSVDADGNMILTAVTEKTVEAVNMIHSFFLENQGVYTMNIGSNILFNDNPLEKIFMEDRSIFYEEMLMRAVDWRAKESDFGILPLPKWDEEQEKYQSQCWNAFSVVAVPADAKDPDMSSAVFEALSCASANDVLPLYLDTVLTYQAARDVESGEMIEIARDGIMFNFGTLHNAALGIAIYRDNLEKGADTLMSTWERSAKVNQKKLDKLLDYYRGAAE